jgi:lysophospholipase L1-like esterase
VINAGQSGDTSAGGLSRMDWLLKNRIDVLVLELGGNDGLRGLPAETTRKNLQAIIDRTREKYPEVKIILAGMKVPPNMGRDYGKQFEAIFPELAKKNQSRAHPLRPRRRRRGARAQSSRRHPPHRQRPRNHRRQHMESAGAGLKTCRK